MKSDTELKDLDARYYGVRRNGQVYLKAAFFESKDFWTVVKEFNRVWKEQKEREHKVSETSDRSHAG